MNRASYLRTSLHLRGGLKGFIEKLSDELGITPSATIKAILKDYYEMNLEEDIKQVMIRLSMKL